MTSRSIVTVAAGLVLMFVGIGCAGPPAIVPNRDKALRRSSAQFAADAAKRHPYQADLPRGGEAAARAEVGYMLDRLEIVNLSDQDWTDVEVWANQRYVVCLPRMPRNELKVINFQMLFDDHGNSMPTNKVMVNKLEVLCDGKMFEVPVRLAD